MKTLDDPRANDVHARPDVAGQHEATDVLNILIIGINYSPEPAGIGPYTTGLAEHLAQRGHAVTVLTSMPHYPQWQIHASYRGSFRRHAVLRGVHLRRFRHYVPADQTAWRRALYEVSFFAQVLTAAHPSPPDVIIGIVPSLGGGAAARLLARRFRRPYGVLFQDLMAPASEQSGMEGGGKVASLVGKAEAWVVRDAAVVGAIAEGFFPYLQAAGVPAERLVQVPNWTHIPEPKGNRDEVRQQQGWQPQQQIVLHAGNMGLKQGLEQVIEAARLADTEAPSVRFVFLGDGSQRSVLEQQSAGLRNCSFLDPVSQERFPELLAAADVLLLSERPSVLTMSLPGKLTSYFAAGRPVVAAVAADGNTAAEIARSGGGVVVAAGDSAGLLSALRRLAEEPALAAQLAVAGRSYQQSNLTAAPALARAEEFVRRIASSTKLAHVPAGRAARITTTANGKHRRN